ncbi:MAG: UDP-2,4-diacetamido-2,4,6-trideoxy-beta-L-altropyranose hydrolase [Proteobacteria bacterium]|nr:UDP-2,4-diacetamido-2,4,6-trideoxy-beta-L-altropyranose hydrolase [Desulfobacula sp.]MBU3954037.1 UDP-2,4-diacetamido-2,4,6-trideoxy-beta-L-altropyranose hydrolase [Pseudomonadota bacterium]MBU4131998.1 UDP-2,4-diacetamido-2,4,6-trideoxy-beta-L-altropyranose hydrolase [Pseudomonadota bacterium]
MIVIICDATRQIGYGHLKRCLVLAGLYRKLGLLVTFLMREATPVVRMLLKDRDMEFAVISDHGQCRPYLVEKKDRIKLVIIDHYEIGADIEQEIFAIFPVVVMDDLCRSHWCHLLVDQTPNCKAHTYEKKMFNPSARILSGSNFILIDPVYDKIKSNGDKTNILISFGATDPEQVALKVLDILEPFMATKGLVFHLPLSSMSPCVEELEKRRDSFRLDIRLYRDLPDLCPLYEICGIAIGAPGTSLLERIYCGLINIVIVVAPNQRQVGENISRQGAALCLGEISSLDPLLLTRTLTQMIEVPAVGKNLQKQAIGLVDGNGPARVIKETIDLISPVSLRLVNENDLELLYKWQHEKGARRYFRKPDLPTKKEHRLWFDRMLSCDYVTIHIIEWCNGAIGYIRLNCNGSKNEVSVLIAQKFQGLGFAKKALEKIIQTQKQCYTAVVHPENKASIGLFSSLGFQSAGKGEYVYDAAP